MTTQEQPSRTFGGGDYHEVRSLGRGGFAEVYLVEDNLGRRWALKQLREDLLRKDPGILDRFEREARIQADLKHPHIAGVHTFNSREGYLVIDYIEGRTLSKLINDDFPEGMDSGTVLEILQPIEDALTYIHERASFAHLDITPRNILIQEIHPLLGKMERRIFLADFGLARVIDTEGQADLSVIMGTPGYWAPEQRDPTRGKPGKRSDIYALGVMIGVMLTGRRPQEVLEMLRGSNNTLPPLLTPQVKRVLQRAVDENPENRYATVKGLVTAFTRAIDEGRVPAPPAPPAQGGDTSDSRRQPAGRRTMASRVIFVYALVVTLVLLGLLGWALVQNLTPRHYARLGGVDLGVYCQSLHYHGNNADSSCFSAIDLGQACNWQYETGGLHAQLQNPDDPYTARCFDAHGKQVGGINDMSGYCKDHRQGYLGIPDAALMDNKTWVCEEKLNVTLACMWTYSRIDVQARKNEQGLWVCYGPA